MSEMPARIWVERSFAWVADKKQNDGVAFVRADIAERMAEALEQCAAVCSGQTMNKSGLVNALEDARSAISEWKDGR